MAVSARCPFCSASAVAEPGQTVACPSCGATFVAAPGGPAPASAPAPAASSPGDVPCPMCGEYIKPGARVCRFCKAQLAGGGPTVPAQPYAQNYNPPPPKKSNCLLWSILGIVGLVIVICVGGPIFMVTVMGDTTTRKMCEKIYEGILSPEVAKLPRGKDPDAKGRETLAKLDRLRGPAFWREVLTSAGQNADGVFCPGKAFEGQQNPYLGPKSAYSALKDADPVGCCPKYAHKGGSWVVYKNGKFEWASEGSDAYAKAYENLTDEKKELPEPEKKGPGHD